MSLKPDALDLVVRTILGEADPNNPASFQAVANVIKNRVDSGAWGTQDRVGPIVTAGKGSQFASWKNGMPAANIQPSDPRYQRAAAVAQAVFSGQLGDNTGGATHFYAPSSMPGGQPPSWAVGQKGQLIGSQYFYKLPLNTQNTAGTTLPGAGPSAGPGSEESPSPAYRGDKQIANGPPSSEDAQAARAFLATLSAHPTRAGDTANFNPEFATRLAAAIKEARAAGLRVGVGSGFREPGTHPSAYDLGGNSSHTYGLASDISGLDGPNGPITQAWAKIAAAHGLSNPYGVGNAAEFNHWQLPTTPLEQTPALLASLKAAKATGDMQAVWDAWAQRSIAPAPGAGPGAGPGSEAAPPPPAPNLGRPAVNPADVPAAQAQPVSASAPAGTGLPGSGQTGANDRFQVLQGLSGGGQAGRNPMLYTALNLAPGAGSTPTPAAPAPAAANVPLPPPRPPNFGGPTYATVTPPPRPVELGGAGSSRNAPSSPIATDAPPPQFSSVLPNVGASQPYDPNALPPAYGRFMPGGGGRFPGSTTGAPSMGYPALQTPNLASLLSQLFNFG